MTRMSRREKQDRINKSMRKVCKNCEEKNGKQDIDKCFKNCPFHVLFNLLSELIA